MCSSLRPALRIARPASTVSSVTDDAGKLIVVRRIDF